VSGETILERAVPALLINLALALAAYRSGGVRPSGIAGGLAVGIPIYLALGGRGFLILVAMFVLGTALTRLGYARKERLGAAEAERGARGASHALANAGPAAVLAVVAAATGDPLWRVAFVAALATSSMDTAGSEIGPVWGGKTISLATLRPAPPGTEGAVSAGGTAAGLLAAALLGVLGWMAALHPAGAVPAVILGALIGNLYEGILGSRHLLSHTWLNATNTVVGAGVAALLARLLLQNH
jgi:uncharacterized protein (TIGR00297 family)